MNTSHKCCLLSLALLSGIASAHGALIAFDPFYSAPNSAGGADPAIGRYLSNVDGGSGSVDSDVNQNMAGGDILGFGSHAWESSTTTFRVQTPSLSTPSRLPDASGGLRVLNFRGGSGTASADHRTASRQLDAYTPSNTYYMSSALSAFTANSGHRENAYLMLGFGNSMITDASTMSGTSTSTFEGLMWGFRANEDGDRVDLVVRATTDAATNTISEFTLLEGIAQQQTYFVAARVDVNESGTDSVTVWLDPVLGASDPVGGVTFQADVLSTLGGITHFGMVQSGLLHSGNNNTTNRVGYIDSIALGTTYGAVIPEPSTYAFILGGVSLLAIGVIRRNRRLREDEVDV